MARVLMVECMQEISSFNPVISNFADFTVQRGEAMMVQAGSNTAIGGAVAEFDNHGDIIVQPVYSARAGSGGILSEVGWRRLSAEIFEAVAAVREPVDGIYFSMHGAMAAENELDPEGALLAGVRDIVGADVAIVITLDLHGILSKRMLSNINGLTMYHTYPHVDFADTGARAAHLLLDIIRGKISPVIARAPIPALVRGGELLTSTGCYGAMIADVQRLEHDGAAEAAGILIGNPFTDVPELCSQVIVITDNNAQLAMSEANRLAERFWQQRGQMQANLVDLEVAIAQAREMKGPVIFTDAADATSSGASGDSVEIVAALLKADYQGRILAPLIDRPAAEWAHEAGVGAKIDVTLGGSLDKRFSPIKLSATIARLSNGRARLETSGHLLDAGPSAILIADNLTLLVMSHTVSLFDRAMFLAHDCNPQSYDLIVVKSPYCEYHMFDEWSQKNFNIDAPGATSANIAALGHKNCHRPMFPMEQNFEFKPASECYRWGEQ
jgi:microcystin degradation protein MlrC